MTNSDAPANKSGGTDAGQTTTDQPADARYHCSGCGQGFESYADWAGHDCCPLRFDPDDDHGASPTAATAGGAR